MATAGQTIDNPVAGDAVTFLELPATVGEPLTVEMTTIPGGQGPPPHVHPRSSEAFSVLSGSITLVLGGRDIVLGAGEARTVPPGCVHTFASHGAEPARTRVNFDRPGRMADFLETFYELVRAGQTDREGKPSLMQIAVSFSALRDDIRTVVPPWPAQVVLFAILAPLGRARGLRAFYRAGELTGRG
jgi:quercetin dioxygenase-like cupin family protein